MLWRLAIQHCAEQCTYSSFICLDHRGWISVGAALSALGDQLGTLGTEASVFTCAGDSLRESRVISGVESRAVPG